MPDHGKDRPTPTPDPEESARDTSSPDVEMSQVENEKYEVAIRYYFQMRTELQILSKFVKYFKKQPDNFSSDKIPSSVRHYWENDPGFVQLKQDLTGMLINQGASERQALNRATRIVQVWLEIAREYTQKGSEIDYVSFKIALNRVVGRLSEGIESHDESKNILDFLKDLGTYKTKNPAWLVIQEFMADINPLENSEGIDEEKLMRGLTLVDELVKKLYGLMSRE